MKECHHTCLTSAVNKKVKCSSEQNEIKNKKRETSRKSNFSSSGEIEYNLRTYKLYCRHAVIHRPPVEKPLFCDTLK